MLYGGVRQVPEALWFRRESDGDERRAAAPLAGAGRRRAEVVPRAAMVSALGRAVAGVRAPEHAAAADLAQWRGRGMLLRYQLTYGWRHFRKTEASHAVGRGIDNVIWTKKITKHHWHHAVYNTLVGGRAAWGRTRRFGRRGVYEVLMLTHRLGLRGRGKAPRDER